MNLLDKTIGYLSPKWAAERSAYRQAHELQKEFFDSHNPDKYDPKNELNFRSDYSGAYPNRFSKPWSQSESIGGMPHLHLQAHRNMRDRARSLCENNAIASSILNRAVEQVVGNGFKLQPQSADPDWNKQAEELFHSWFPNADYYNRTWLEHQRLIATCLFRDGDVGSALLKRGQVQLVEGDYISSPYNRPEAYLHDGIQLDDKGRIKSFWVMQYVDIKNKEWRPVAPKDFCFIANRRRVVQYRGETSFAQSFQLFEQVSDYVDAAVLSAKIAACISLFINTPHPAGMVQGLNVAQSPNGQGNRIQRFEPGMVQYLGPGETITQTNPAQPGNGFENNLRMLMRVLGLSFGLPLENVLLDFSQTSFSSAKASQLQAQRVFEYIQHLLIDSYYSRMYRWRVSKFVKEGLLEYRPDMFKHRWLPQPWPYLDPVKELQAQLLAYDAGLDTERRAVTARGGDYDSMLLERAREVQQKLKFGLPAVHSTLSLPFYGGSGPTASGVDNPDAQRQQEENRKEVA